ncbi:hypothetical protein DL766_001404 [Monosporascus sp. MC13-8B]|uniref:Zn(2)-C6 fungal-type domain-containing protein n=1 Tax=Monosporascus cannonballus TaxID=155416 RepID=A0ABY0HH42_9PEZI|nr:hypothetical protein DL762_001233 [Monosporascus cannonballus]RYO98868.1 hypothetical protein DL763_001911 [Monosporascus cannonballus]RYP37755.1 hypothetical protein DL766_001404 [Monosporascus sp. MC13-8B]
MSFPLDPHQNSQPGPEKPTEQRLTSCMDCWANGLECEFTPLLKQETTVVGCLECAGAGSHCYVPVSDLPLLQLGLYTAVSGKRKCLNCFLESRECTFPGPGGQRTNPCLSCIRRDAKFCRIPPPPARFRPPPDHFGYQIAASGSGPGPSSDDGSMCSGSYLTPTHLLPKANVPGSDNQNFIECNAMNQEVSDHVHCQPQESQADSDYQAYGSLGPIARRLASEEGRSPLSPPPAPLASSVRMLEIPSPDPEGLALSPPCPSTKADTGMTDRENQGVGSMSHITQIPQTLFDPWMASTRSQWPAEIWKSQTWCARCVGLGLECYGFPSGGDCYRCQREKVACVSLDRRLPW